MNALHTSFKPGGYFLLAILLQDYCLTEALKPTSVPTTSAVFEGKWRCNVFDYWRGILSSG